MTSKLVRNHSHWGAFLAEVRDGRIIGVRPLVRNPYPSALIEAIPSAVHSTTRIAQPMVREGWLARGPGRGEGRGRERFVPVSWERALDLVAGELDRVGLAFCCFRYDRSLSYLATSSSSCRPEFPLRRRDSHRAASRRAAWAAVRR